MSFQLLIGTFGEGHWLVLVMGHRDLPPAILQKEDLLVYDKMNTV